MTHQAFKFFPLGQLAQHAFPSDEELIMLVDNQNRELGFRPRSLTCPHPFWIRASYVFVEVCFGKHEEKKFLIQKRSKTKDYAPSCFMLSSGGVFAPGEGKLENALRELEEETGLTVNHCGHGGKNTDSWQDAGWMNYVDQNSRVWASLYLYRTTEKIVSQQLDLQEEEVEDVQFWTKDEIVHRIERQNRSKVPYTDGLSDGPQPGEIAPCSIAAFEHLHRRSFF